MRAVKTIVLQGREVGNCSDDLWVMADKVNNEKTGNYPAASGPNMANCENNSQTPGVSMHYLQKDKTLWKKWTQFVGVHRKDLGPLKSATLCSVHFDEKCFESKPVLFTYSDNSNTIHPKGYLLNGSVQYCAKRMQTNFTTFQHFLLLFDEI